jgi:hypothetical protein
LLIPIFIGRSICPAVLQVAAEKYLLKIKEGLFLGQGFEKSKHGIFLICWLVLTSKLQLYSADPLLRSGGQLYFEQ